MLVREREREREREKGSSVVVTSCTWERRVYCLVPFTILVRASQSAASSPFLVGVGGPKIYCQRVEWSHEICARADRLAVNAGITSVARSGKCEVLRSSDYYLRT